MQKKYFEKASSHRKDNQVNAENFLMRNFRDTPKTASI